MNLNRMSVLRLAAFAGACLLAGPATAAVVARVDGIEITDDDVKIALDDIGPTMPPDMQGPARENYVIDYLIDLKLVARKAEAEKKMDQAEFARRMAYYHDKVMMEGSFGELGKQSTTEQALRKVYDEVSKAQTTEPEVHARHILVATEDLAKRALQRLKTGEDFAKVAKDMSTDPGSEGGDLGWFTKDQMVPEFGDAAFKMKEGELSAPVKSQFGWHVIKLEGKRSKPFPDFESVHDQVSRYAVQKAQADYIARLRETAKIEKVTP